MTKAKITFELSGDKVGAKAVAAIAREFFSAAKFRSSKHFSLAIVSGTEMRKWNRIYRGKDKVTDVLSFAEADVEMDGADSSAVALAKAETGDLGEILIYWPQLSRQAKEYGWSQKTEFARLLVHGLAHLAGYDHEGVSAKEAQRMTEFEKKILSRLKINLDQGIAKVNKKVVQRRFV